MSAISGPTDKTRARLCFRLTIYGPRNNDGQKWWLHNYPRYEEVLAGAEILGVGPERPDKLDWKNLVMNMLDPNKRRVVSEAGRTQVEPLDSGTIGQPPKSQQQKLNQDGSSKWRISFPPIPHCDRCLSDKELILLDLQGSHNETSETEPVWRIGDQRMAPLGTKKPEWFEFWNWVCTTCEPHKLDHALTLWEIRRQRVNDTTN